METLTAMATVGIINNFSPPPHPPGKIIELGLVATLGREISNTPVRAHVWPGF